MLNSEVGPYQEIVDNLPVGLVVVDSQQVILFWNSWLVERTGISPERALNKKIKDLYPAFNSEKFASNLQQVLAEEGVLRYVSGSVSYFFPITSKAGAQYGIANMPQQVYLSPLMKGSNPQVLITLIDVTENVIKELTLSSRAQQLEEFSNRDQLSQAYNRRYLETWLKEKGRQALLEQTAIGFLMIDIDGFKQINDTQGHDIGDKVIQQFAKVIQDQLRSSDILVRFGGEEFLALLTNVTPDTVAKAAERVRGAVAATAFEGFLPGAVTCSIGATCWQSDEATRYDEIIKYADELLYRMKRAGKNCVQYGDYKRSSET